jgi:hypothetical protein
MPVDVGGRVIVVVAGAYLSRVSRCGLGNTVVSSWFVWREAGCLGERGPTIFPEVFSRRQGRSRDDAFDREKRFERHASDRLSSDF